MSEAEALAIRFTIDHYEPQKIRPELADAYDNLMYACDECNIRKGDRCPPPAARADDYRFFRPDLDRYEEHFEARGQRLESKSNTGFYSIQAMDLNRLSLRRLRELRRRLMDCNEMVAQGIHALRRFRIDQLPQHVKGRATTAIADAIALSKTLSDKIDELLREHARSELIDPDTEADAASRLQDRNSKLEQLRSMYPGNWRAPRAKKSGG